MEIDNVLKRQLRTESYDQKLEHRAAKHECLRDRNNVTSCRSPGTPQESEWKSIMRRKRQREFQKRRKISSEAALAAGGKEATQKEKVTLRGNRRKVPLIHRQSLVSSQDLGIIWPDINAFAEVSRLCILENGNNFPQASEALKRLPNFKRILKYCSKNVSIIWTQNGTIFKFAIVIQ